MSERIILIGTDNPGLTAASTFLKTRPESEVLVIYPELNPLPEFTCDKIDRHLQKGMIFQETLKAFGIDRERKLVLVRDEISGMESELDYGTLIIATGAAPQNFDIPGDHLPEIVRVGTFEDASKLKPIEGKTLIIGKGASLLMTVSCLLRHKSGTIEVVIPKDCEGEEPLSDNLSGMVFHHLETAGVTIHRDQTLTAISKDESGIHLKTTEQGITADRVINATFSKPVTENFSSSGLALDEHGGVIVDSRMGTNDKSILACGSCATFTSHFCDIPVPGAQIRASEHRQACSVAARLAGWDREFTTPPGAYSIDLGKFTVSGAGLTVEEAKKCGFSPMSSTVIQFDRAHFMFGVELMTLELVFDAPTRRVLGIQGLAKSGQALSGRVSAVSAILPRKPAIEDISNLEIAYSPPFSSAMDVLNTAANVADNMLEGINEGISAAEFREIWSEREKGNRFFLDCREIGNAGQFVERHPDHWNHIPQGEIARRLAEIPDDRQIVLICNTGARSYEAQVTLKHAGYSNVVNVDGGMTAIRQSGIEL